MVYPPLTYLKPTGRTHDIKVKCGCPGMEANFTVMEVEPTV